MGLDMYLWKKTYIGAGWGRPAVGRIQITMAEKKVPIKFKRVESITESVGYWRKANAIHAWFVKNVQSGKDDCEKYQVSLEQLKELVSLCKKVKESAKLVNGMVKNGYTFEENGKKKPILEKGKVIADTSDVEDLLPTQDGFFFGSTEYDENYMYDVEETIRQLEPLIVELEEESNTFTTIYYQSSW